MQPGQRRSQMEPVLELLEHLAAEAKKPDKPDRCLAGKSTFFRAGCSS